MSTRVLRRDVAESGGDSFGSVIASRLLAPPVTAIDSSTFGAFDWAADSRKRWQPHRTGSAQSGFLENASLPIKGENLVFSPLIL